MTKQDHKLPFYIKYFYVLGGLILSVVTITYLNLIISPILVAAIFALGISPICEFLEKYLPSMLSSLICVTFLIFIFLITFIIMSSQIANININLDVIFDKVGNVIDSVIVWGAEKINITPPKQMDYLKASLTAIGKDLSAYVNVFVSTTTRFVTGFVFFVITLFFFLYYRKFFLAFFFQLTASKEKQLLKSVVLKIENVVTRYVIGLFFVISIVAILNVIGLMVIGVDHALVFGVIGAILLIIPYIGIAIGAALPTLYMLASTDSLWYPISVILVFSIVQILESNFITPNIMGNQVNLNPFAVILGILLGGLLLGFIGIIFAVPLLGILKIIFDNIPTLTPFGFIIGNPPRNLR